MGGQREETWRLVDKSHCGETDYGTINIIMCHWVYYVILYCILYWSIIQVDGKKIGLVIAPCDTIDGYGLPI